MAAVKAERTKKVYEMHCQGMKPKEIAEHFNISLSSVYQIIDRIEEQERLKTAMINEFDGVIKSIRIYNLLRRRNIRRIEDLYRPDLQDIKQIGIKSIKEINEGLIIRGYKPIEVKKCQKEA